MKICNKRGFWTGLAFCLSGVFSLVLLAVKFFRVFLWFWWLDAAVSLLIGGILLARAVSPEKARQDLSQHWRLGEIVIYNKYGFMDGIFLLLCAAGSLVTALSGRIGPTQVEAGWSQYVITILFVYFGLGRVVRAVTLEEARRDIVEERDERNQIVAWKWQAKSYRITQIVSLLLACFFVLKGGTFNQLDLTSVGTGILLCFLISAVSELFTRKYYETHS